MTSPLFEASQNDLLEAVQASATVDEAAKTLGLSVNTVRSWLSRGRKAPDGPYGTFARQLDEIRSARRLPDRAERGSLTREEWEGCLAESVRAGNVQAMRLWHDTHIAEGERDDPFAEFASREAS